MAEMRRFVCSYLVAMSLASGSTAVVSASEAPGRLAYARMSRSVVKVSTQASVGTGFFIEDGQHVATAYHVVSDGADITVTDSAGITHRPDGWWYNEAADVAILHLQEPTRNVALLSGSYLKASPGDAVFVLGYPGPSLGVSFTAGVLSAKKRSDGIGLLQVDAAIGPGSSGSPVSDEVGQVLGIMSFTFTKSQAANVAVQIGAALELLERPMRAIERPLDSSGDVEVGTRAQSPSAASAQVLADFMDPLYRSLLTWDINAQRRWQTLRASTATPQIDRVEADYKLFLVVLDAMVDRGWSQRVPQEIEALYQAASERATAEVSWTSAPFKDSRAEVDELRERLVAAVRRLWLAIPSAMIAAAGREAPTRLQEAREIASPVVSYYQVVPRLLGCLPDPVLSIGAFVAHAERKSSLKEGDCITHIWSESTRTWHPIATWRDVSRALNQTAQERVTCRVNRKGRTIEIACDVFR